MNRDITDIYIDGDQIHFCEKEFGKIDYIKLLKYLANRYGMGQVSVNFYFGTGSGEEGSDEERNNSWRRRIDYICNRLREELKDVVTFYKGAPLAKDNVDINLVSDLYESLFDFKDQIYRIVLVSGDGDYSKAIRRAKIEGVEDIVVVSMREGFSRFLKLLATEICYVDDIIQSNPDLIINEE